MAVSHSIENFTLLVIEMMSLDFIFNDFDVN